MTCPWGNKKTATGLSIATWSPVRLLLALLCAAFCGKTFVMFLLPHFGPMTGWRQALLEAAVFSVLMLPALYFLVFPPASACIDERGKTCESLRDFDERYPCHWLRALSREVSVSQEAERRRIAEELHDFLGQRLALCKLDLAELKGLLPDRKAAKVIERLGEEIDESLTHVRALTKRLSPLILYELGLEAALKSLLGGLRGVEGTFVDASTVCALADTLREEQGFALYMAVREMVLNVLRHAQAGRLKVTFRRDENTVRVEVADDGRGFDPSTVSTGLGTFVAKERLAALGGTMEITTAPGKGTSVVFSAPTESIYAAAAEPQEG